jgi:hypothetical protein
MAADFIPLDMQKAGATQAPLLKNYINALRAALNAGTQVRAMMTHMNDGSDFSRLEVLFGAPSGSGQTLFDLVNGSTGAMVGDFQNRDCQTITEKVG